MDEIAVVMYLYYKKQIQATVAEAADKGLAIAAMTAVLLTEAVRHCDREEFMDIVQRGWDIAEEDRGG